MFPMTYFNKNAELKSRYNAIIDTTVASMAPQMHLGMCLVAHWDASPW